VVTRKANGKAVLKDVTLPGLLNPAFAETLDFKIVDKKSEKALTWANLSQEDRMRAANLLYHLNNAKQVFINRFHSEEVAHLEQVIIRMNLSNSFDSIGHFANDARDPQFNNAHSIPASSSDDQAGIPDAPSWNREIWFRPKKEISMRELLSRLPEDPLAATEKSLRQSIYPTLVQQGLGSSLGSIFNGNAAIGPTLLSTLVRQGGTAIAIEGSFEIMKLVNRIALPRAYYLDTGMVPEIIDHEFSHIALSDYLKPTHATPVVEGMADYFASVISGSPELAKKIKAYSKGVGKDGRKPKTFNIAYDTNGKATSDFVLSVLWGIRDVLGEEAANKLIWETRKRLNTFDSTLREGDSSLVNALLRTCDESRDICPDANTGRLKLLQYFSDDIGF
jgi:hypothetical protein